MPRITNALNSPFLISITSVIVSGIVALGASTLFARFVTRNKKNRNYFSKGGDI